MDQASPEVERLRSEFRKRYGNDPRAVVRAPGRVNLIGEHTDYNEGFVFPAAIEFATWVAVSHRDDKRLLAASLQFPETLESDLPASRARRGDWTDYCWGVVEALRSAGLRLRGTELLVWGNVPIGAGLSSSASLEVAVALALLTGTPNGFDRVFLAQVCQAAENNFVGARCGIMDQFIACTGKVGHAVLLDCRSLQYSYAPIPSDVSLVICNTMVKHSIAGGEYNRRRAECEQGVSILSRYIPGISALRDVSIEQLRKFGGELPDMIRKRCRHVISENARVQDALGALRSGDLDRFGELMYQSHASLRDDYEVSCPELDTMVEIARRQKGVIGARMTGGGFGGCTINLVYSEAAETFRAAVASEYEKATDIRPDIYITSASGGAERIA